MSTRVLIVDDDRNIRRMLTALLESEGFELEDVRSGAEAPPAVDRFDPHVVLLDLVMPPGPDGLATMEQFHARYPELVVVMMSGQATLADAVRATRLGAFQFLEKPLTPEAVISAVRAGADLFRTRAENRALRNAVGADDNIVGDSDVIQAVQDLVVQVARTPARVLITGESGTGKELVARSIHAQSPRRARPFVGVNCAAIPRDLLESEMFGHERGAFTGAVNRRQGKFELADGGTLFLDEVGDLSLDAQAKLLRALEAGTIERVGGEREITVDVRIVAATNRDLESAVGEGAFREDLFYRLNVFPISVPPLRNRQGDIPALISHFAELAGARCGGKATTFTPAATKLMARHTWPGNVRELANIVERITIITGGDGATETHVRGVLASGATTRLKRATGSLPDALEAYEAELITDALEQADGNIADAARRLQTDRANLYRRMKRLGIGH